MIKWSPVTPVMSQVFGSQTFSCIPVQKCAIGGMIFLMTGYFYLMSNTSFATVKLNLAPLKKKQQKGQRKRKQVHDVKKRVITPLLHRHALFFFLKAQRINRILDFQRPRLIARFR